tara:strand:- start:359 stop:604 length:246 start_codon:yes stop_codon:yes gene_type:complete
MKNKQDILKLHPMIGILTPMQWDEIHKAMDAYLNEYKAEQLTLTDVVVPKGTCCLKPKKIGKVNDMFESWDECKNCGKEVL